MRSDAELCVHTFADDRTESVVRVAPNEVRRDAGWSRPPSWSSDGTLVWFSITTSERRPTSLAPNFVAEMKRRAAQAAKRRKGHGRVSYSGSIEGTFWNHEHANGIVDLARRAVWLREANIGRATLR